MDGSGKSAERPILSEEHIEHNVQSIQTLLERLLAQSSQQDMPKPIFLNNLDWFGAMPLLTFLRQVSKACRICCLPCYTNISIFTLIVCCVC